MSCVGPILVFPTWWSLAANVLLVVLLTYAVLRARRLHRLGREAEALMKEIRG